MTQQLQHCPSRHLAFISLALGFLGIWTAVLSGVLVSRSLQDETIAKETLHNFHRDQDVGRIAFALGHELVSTVDWLLSRNSQQNEWDMVNVTWKITDSVLRKVKNSIEHWEDNLLAVLNTIEIRLNKFRLSSSNSNAPPLEVVRFYLDLNKWMLHRCLMLDYSGQRLPATGLPYMLFIKGMQQKFAELALGTIYVKSDIPVNKSEFLLLRAGSRELMEAAFHFTPRASTKWWELQEQGSQIEKVAAVVVDDILSGDSMRGHKELFSAYLDGVKNQIAMLLLTKEVLNSTLASWVEHLSQRSHNTFAFHLSIVIVALVAVVLCLIVTACSCPYFGRDHKEKHSQEEFWKKTQSLSPYYT